MNLPITMLSDARHEDEARRFVLQSLAQQIADETCRTDIECKARSWPSNLSTPVYDVSELEPTGINDPDLIEADQLDLERAVRYLDLRGLLVRPIAGQQHLVSIGAAS
jgi:hypothetical protein